MAAAPTVLVGLGLLGIVFALNSAVHSYLVLAYSEDDRVSLSVGFYYMANAAGRLMGDAAVGTALPVGRVSASAGAVVLAGVAGTVALALPPVSDAATAWTSVKGDD